MEKYGVEETETQPKTADDETSKCPKCDAKLRNQDETGVLVCPVCGTAPFEE